MRSVEWKVRLWGESGESVRMGAVSGWIEVGLVSLRIRAEVGSRAC